MHYLTAIARGPKLRQAALITVAGHLFGFGVPFAPFSSSSSVSVIVGLVRAGRSLLKEPLS